MLGEGNSCVTISFTSTSIALHLLLAKLEHTLSLVTVGEAGDTVVTVGDTVVETISNGVFAGAALSTGKGLVWVVVDVHGVGVDLEVGSGLTGDGAAAAGVGLLTDTGASSILVVTSGVQTTSQLGELLGLGAAGDLSAVLERLAHLGVVAHENALLADEIGLHAVVRILGVLHALVGFVVSIRLELLLFLLESSELGLDIGVHEIVDVLAVPHLGDLVVVPVLVGKLVVALHIEAVNTSTTVLLLEVALQSPAVGVVLVVFGEVLDGLRNEGLTDTAHRLGNVDTGEDIAETAAGVSRGGARLELLGNTLSKELVTSGVLDGAHTLGGGARNLQHLNILGLEDFLELLLVLRLQIFGTADIDLVDNDVHNLVGEEGLDAVEKLDLVTDRVSTLLGKIHEVENGGAEMGNSGDRLHFNGVHLLERVVQNSRGINGLETKVLVVEVTNEQTLGGESVGLNIDIRAGDVAQETRLSDVGVSTDQESTSVGVDGGETTQVLANLLQVHERVLETAGDGGHTTEGGLLKLLALEQRLRILDQTDVIARNGFNQVLGGRNLTKGNTEVVGIVKSVHQILVWKILDPTRAVAIAVVKLTERMDIDQTRESIENVLELFTESLLGVLDLSGVEA